MIVEHEKKMNAPHELADVVKLKAKLLHLETFWWLGVASLMYESDHPIVHPPSALMQWLHPSHYPPMYCCPKSKSSIILGIFTIMGQQPQVVVHINQTFGLFYIQTVSLDVVDEAVGVPTTLY